MSEGPYRDLGNGFARLTGVEGVRRAPSRIVTVEDALLELVRNAADAGAENVYVATALHARRYRELVVIDDGCGVPEDYREMIFEAGVTTLHLAPSRLAERSHGSGLSLHHVKESAISAEVISTGSPTSVRAVFDTESLPERSLQSSHSSRRNSRSNLSAILTAFATTTGAPEVFYGSPASTISLLLNKRIILKGLSAGELESWCTQRLGASISRRTLQRVVNGEVSPAERVERVEIEAEKEGEALERVTERFTAPGGRLILDERDLSEIKSVIAHAARESYLEVGDLQVESKEGEITVYAKIHEAEEEYGE